MDEKTAAAIEKLKQNKGLAEQLMRSGDGQALLSLLARGDTAALSQMLRALMDNKEAAAIMSRLSDSAKK